MANQEFNKYKEALAFAIDHHKGIVRKSGQPYINHPCQVLKRVQKFSTRYNTVLTQEEKIACLLHDCIEDEKELSLKEISDIIEKSFGSAVLALVLELTNVQENRDKFERMKDEELKQLYNIDKQKLIKKITDFPGLAKKLGKILSLESKMLNMSSIALIIKLCDRLVNVDDLMNLSQKFRTRKIVETEIILHYIEENRTLEDIHQAIIAEIKKILSEIKRLDEENSGRPLLPLNVNPI